VISFSIGYLLLTYIGTAVVVVLEVLFRVIEKPPFHDLDDLQSSQ
jgi:hypothetical protein